MTLYTAMLTKLYVRISILLAYVKQSHDLIISLRNEGWYHVNSFIPPYFIEVPVPMQGSEQSYLC